MNENEDKREGAEETEADTEGHGLFLDAEVYGQRRGGRDADLERQLRDRERAKEARPNKPNQR